MTIKEHRSLLYLPWHYQHHRLLAGCTAALAAIALLCVQPAAARTATGSPNACIPAHQFIELLPAKVGGYTNDYQERTAPLGMYERISPSGRYILRSFSGSRLGDVTILELPDPRLRLSPAEAARQLRFYRTPLKNEAFPVQGSWRYLVNPNGEHYRFGDILRAQEKARPVFKAGMTGFYAAAAELPHPENSRLIRIRSMSWPNADGDMDTQGVGNLRVRTITVNPATHRVTDSGSSHSLCDNRAREDGLLFALPMISTDGLEFSALPQKTTKKNTPTMHIYRFGKSGTGCTLADRFSQKGGKTIFGYTKHSRNSKNSRQAAAAPLAYEYESQIWWHNRSTKQSYNITPGWSDIGILLTPRQQQHTSLLANGFPGITRDGRVIYGAKIRYCAQKPCHEKVGIIITDPYQSTAWRNSQPAVQPASQPTTQCIRYRDLPVH